MKNVGIKAILMAMIFPLLVSCSSKSGTEDNASSQGNENNSSGSISTPIVDNEPRLEVINKILFGFDTTYSVKMWNAPASAMAKITSIINDMSDLCDNYRDYPGVNNVYTINHSDVPVKIDERLFNLLEKCLEYKTILNGYFDPLTGKISKLWKDYLNVETGPMIPTKAQLDPLIKEVRQSRLILDKKNMTAQIIGDAELDLGAVAKGYSLNLFKEVFDARKVSEYLVSGGDSSIALGKKPGSLDFSVGLKDIKKAYFTSHDEFVSTSSMFEQGHIVNGVKYNHIVNPYTGSAETNFDLVLVKGPIDSGLLDCMSTAFSCMSLEEIKVYEHKYDIDILVYDDEEILYQSENMEVKYH